MAVVGPHGTAGSWNGAQMGGKVQVKRCLALWIGTAIQAFCFQASFPSSQAQLVVVRLKQSGLQSFAQLPVL